MRTIDATARTTAGIPVVFPKGLRAAAAAAGDLERVHLWAGTEAHRVREAPAVDVLASLTP